MTTNWWYLITEQADQREKAVMEELEIIESQVNNNKPQQQVDEPHEPESVEMSQPMEDCVENLDPNPEHISDAPDAPEVSKVLPKAEPMEKSDNDEKLTTDIQAPDDIIKSENHD